MVRISSGVFLDALRLFRRCLLYANALNDRTVPYHSASIHLSDVYLLHTPYEVCCMLNRMCGKLFMTSSSLCIGAVHRARRCLVSISLIFMCLLSRRYKAVWRNFFEN